MRDPCARTSQVSQLVSTGQRKVGNGSMSVKTKPKGRVEIEQTHHLWRGHFE